MGTNYFWISPEGVRYHIGKSSAGWCFALHVYPDEGIYNLDSWKERWRSATPREVPTFTSEYGDVLRLAEMLDEITQRSWPAESVALRTPKYYEQNHAVPGPNYLMRSMIDPHALSLGRRSTGGTGCIGYGCDEHGVVGTYDLIIGDFS